mgnify:CR=1|jgi:hypothetical protein
MTGGRFSLFPEVIIFLKARRIKQQLSPGYFKLLICLIYAANHLDFVNWV